MTLVVSNEDLERVLSMDDALAVLEAMYRDYGEGRAVNGPLGLTRLGASEHPVRSRGRQSFDLGRAGQKRSRPVGAARKS